MAFPTSHSDEAHELLESLKAKCPMRSRRLEIRDREFDIWTACDLDPLLEEMSNRPDDDPDVMDERLPYWAELWPASEALGEALIDRRDNLPADQWLEIGCGPGLPGVAAASLGAFGTATDYSPDAGRLARLNAIQNGCGDRFHFRLLDWREPDPDLAVPWILAADIAYEERSFQPLLDCFDALLEPGGEIWLAEPGRSISKPFFLELEEAGWDVKTLHRRKLVTIHRIRRLTDR